MILICVILITVLILFCEITFICSIIDLKHYKFWHFPLSGQYFLVAMVICWLPWPHVSFQDNTYPLSILSRSLIPTCITKIGQYGALKWYFHDHSNRCQDNWTWVVFLSFGSKGPPSCKISMTFDSKHQRFIWITKSSFTCQSDLVTSGSAGKVRHLLTECLTKVHMHDWNP